MVKLRFNSRKWLDNGALFLPEKVENTEEISPSCLSFRGSGDDSVTKSRFAVPEYLTTWEVGGHLRQFGETSLFMMSLGCTLWCCVGIHTACSGMCLTLHCQGLASIMDLYTLFFGEFGVELGLPPRIGSLPNMAILRWATAECDFPAGFRSTAESAGRRQTSDWET